nr:uncharacterized protein LOC109193506 [Ipomoea trifida]
MDQNISPDHPPTPEQNEEPQQTPPPPPPVFAKHQQPKGEIENAELTRKSKPRGKKSKDSGESGKGNTVRQLSRLDRVLWNIQLTFPEAKAVVLPRLYSDHNPVLFIYEVGSPPDRNI